MSEKKNILVENSANGIKFTIGNESHVLSAKGIKELKSHLSQWLEWYSHYIHYAKIYKDYSFDKIDDKLNLNEKRWAEYDEDEKYKTYSIGSDFASFLQTKSENGYFADNHKAAEIIKEDWAKEFPQWKKELSFDPERSFCYVYTEKRDVARAFLWWSYNKYIKDELAQFDLSDLDI
jgi:hypothetical protein